MSEHDWDDGIPYIRGSIACGDSKVELLRHCRLCQIGYVFPLPPGHSAKSGAMGPYAPWDGTSTCKEVLEKRVRDAAKWREIRAQGQRKLATELPRRKALVAELNALVAKHGAHISASDEMGFTVEFEPVRYELQPDMESVERVKL